MGTDRINLGLHANNSLGVGLYVSKPGSNVMDPASSTSANLMFNSNEGSSLHVIQSGTFNITCKRETLDIPAISQDNQSDYWKALQAIGYSIDPVKSKISNWLETGTIHIPLTSPLPNGEIPEVALRFAVGNSSGHFHPWYANVTTSGSGMNWDEFTYANSAQIVHMDSPWVRVKWGGIGNESYSGAQQEYTKKNFMKLLDDGVLTLSELSALLNSGANTREDLEAVIDSDTSQMKQFSTVKGNSQGAVGLIHYCNSVSLTVDAFMSPTHAGRREYGRGEYEQDSMSDFSNWNFPMETETEFHEPIIHASYGDWQDYRWAYPYNEGTFSSIDISRIGGRIARYAHNAFGSNIAGNMINEIRALPYPLGPSKLLTVLPGSVNPSYPDSYGGVSTDWLQYEAFLHNVEYGVYGPEKYRVSRIPFDHLPMVDNFLSPMEQLVEVRQEPYYGWNDSIGGYWSNFNFSGNPYITSSMVKPGLQTLGRGYGRMAKDDGNQDMYGWKAHPTQFFVNPYSNNQVTFGGLYQDDISYEYKTAALGGAGTGEDDAWDTFYCSYAVYSFGGAMPVYETQAPDTVIIDVRSKDEGGDLQNTSKYKNTPATGGAGDSRYYNLSFPEDFVGTKGSSFTDKFYLNRDYSDPQQRIYGNLNIIFKIPSVHNSNYSTAPDGDFVYIGSEEFVLGTRFVGETEVPTPEGTPAPAITFDLSDNEFIFENNKNLTLTIENSGYVMGGGGSGGRGSVTSSFFSGTPDQYNGGGGGAGGGSGGFEEDNAGSHNGVGIGGTGYGQVLGFGLTPSTDEDQKGKTGESLNDTENFISKTDPHAGYEIQPSGGIAASKYYSLSASGLYGFFRAEPEEGGDGGDAIRVITGSVLPVIDIINKSNVGPDAIFASGGGGGGGGVGKTTTDVDNDGTQVTILDISGTHHEKASGASGGAAGHHGNSQKGNPSSTFYPTNLAGLYVPEPTQYRGGLAGYLVSDSTGGPYQGKVYIRNESSKTIYGRAPSLYEHTNPGTVTRNHESGFSIAQGETKTHQGT